MNGWEDNSVIDIFLKIYVVRFVVLVKLLEVSSFYLL